MNKLTGTAKLHYRGETRQVHVCLNLDKNVIEVRHAVPSLVNTSNWNKCPVVLTDFSLGILQGGPVTLRGILENKTMTINLSSHEGKSLGHLYKNYEDAGPLLQRIYDFLVALSPSDWSGYRRAIYFFLQGLGGVVPLEVRTISFFTFLEKSIIAKHSTRDHFQSF